VNAPSAQWRTVTTLAERECETCAHAKLRHVVAIEHRMCAEPSVLQSMGRDLVSASLARDEVCGGRQWRPA
jgi:hypothetical protein